MDVFVMTLANGIAFGAILFLLASGLTVMLGFMGILNLAHGALYMIGAYVGWSVAVEYGLNFGLALLAAGMAGGLVGLVMERGFLRHLYKQLDDQILITLGFIYILGNLSLWVWGPRARVPFTAPFLSGSLDIGDWSYPMSRVSIILVGLVLAIGLWWLQDKTRVGAIIRAGMDDKQMTIGLGINVAVFSLCVFFLGAFIAGCAGVIGAPMFGAWPESCFEVLFMAVVVVIVGGMGSIQGALLASMLIGVIDAFGKALFPDFAMFTIYLVMIIVLVVRPSGLLGRRG